MVTGFVLQREFRTRWHYGTHRPEELVHMSRVRIHDKLEDLLLPDLAENLPVSARRGLSDIHFGSHCRRDFDQVLKFEQTCNIPSVHHKTSYKVCKLLL